VALALRARRAADALRDGEAIVLTAPAALGVRRLRAVDAGLAGDPRVVCAELGEIAFGVVRERNPAADLIDDGTAAEIFERVVSGLFALEWTEFVSADVDPEIAGMRSPDRFADAALRLIRKLRVAGMSPEAFEAAGLAGAAAFYAHPPNFANPELIGQTKAQYRDSLSVSRTELEHQRTREIDLLKILVKLYRSYLGSLVERGCLTAVDALVEAAALLRQSPGDRARWSGRLRYCFVDDAQDLDMAQAGFLRALYGDALANVTMAGDREQRTLGFAAPRADKTLDRAAARFALSVAHRPVATGNAISVYRAGDLDTEAAFVARAVADAIAEGVPPREIAVIARGLRCIEPYLDALVARDVAVDIAGEGPLYDFRDTGDALAPLWALADPYRHDWLLRNLEAPWLRLSDATIALLCGEPSEPQTLLFEPEGPEQDDRGRRWDRRRSLRLGRNVVRGDRDADLSATARERLAAFRAARARWSEIERRDGLVAAASAIFADTVLAAGGNDAAARLRAGFARRLLDEIERFAARDPFATLLDVLLHAERQATGDVLPLLTPADPDAVAVRTVEAAKGYDFARVFVVDVRSGAFPRYYVPEAFLFSSKYGMIAKENAGGASAAMRTAKFTYCDWKLGFRDLYNAEERRAFLCAVSRARDRAVVSASGRATRGAAAPELLEELRSSALSLDRVGRP
jgi:superfamily I DNA/RNA helicase